MTHYPHPVSRKWLHTTVGLLGGVKRRGGLARGTRLGFSTCHLKRVFSDDPAGLSPPYDFIELDCGALIIVSTGLTDGKAEISVYSSVDDFYADEGEAFIGGVDVPADPTGA